MCLLSRVWGDWVKVQPLARLAVPSARNVDFPPSSCQLPALKIRARLAQRVFPGDRVMSPGLRLLGPVLSFTR